MSVDTPARGGRQHRRIAGGERAACSPPGRLVGPLSAACYFPDLVTPGAVKDSIRYRNMMGVALGPAISCCGSTAGKRWIVRCYGCRPGQKRCGA